MRLILWIWVLVMYSCTTESGTRLQMDYLSILIPEEFEVLESGPTELLKLNYKNQFFVVLQDNMNQNMNLTPAQRESFDRTLYTLRFQKVLSRYKGFYAQEPRYWEIDGHHVVSREFMSLTGEVEVYYDYSIIKMDEKYVEILVTGKKDQRQEHIPVINRLLTSIRKV